MAEQRRAIGWMGLLAAGVLLGAAPAAAQTPAPEKHPGYPYFQQYCASCHGVYADGKGRVAESLKETVPDLRHLTEKYGSPLPEAKLAQFIEGTNMPRAHGSSDMPVWGKELRKDLPAGLANQPARRAIIDLIVDYLVAIQQPAAATPKP